MEQRNSRTLLDTCDICIAYNSLQLLQDMKRGTSIMSVVHTLLGISRGNFCRLFTDSQFLQCLVIFLSLLNLSQCLYEDQIGKFDWKQNYVGKVKYASFDSVYAAKKIIVVTEENVIAALNIRTGQILWRRLFEKGYAGQVRAFANVANGEFVSVSGNVPAIVRYWNLATGHILNEWILAERNPDRIEDVKWHIRDGKLHHILPIYNSGIEVTSYDCKSGEKLNTRNISVPFISQETKCLLAASYYICLVGNTDQAKLSYVNIFDSKSQPQLKPINAIFDSHGPYHISLVPGNVAAITVSAGNSRKKRMILFEQDPIPIPRDIEGENFLYLTTLDGKKVLLETSYNNGATRITATELSANEAQPEKIAYVTSNSLYMPKIVANDCTYQTLKAKNCKFLLASEDHSISLLHQKVVWTREEALATISAVEIVDLPISDREQAIEKEFDQTERDVFGMLIRRLTSQANQMKTFIESILGLEPLQSSQRADLVRDKFGLHKIIVAVSNAGKIFGIETKRGEIIWQLRIPNIRGFDLCTKNIILYIQRGSRHFPHPAFCSLIAADKETNNGVIFSFNPINGQPLSDISRLGYRIKQSLLLHTTTDTYLRPIVLLDSDDRVHVYPDIANPIAESILNNLYIFTVNKTTGVVTGYSLQFASGNHHAHKVWEQVFNPKIQRITHVASKNPIERVHSQGRVLSDRSVLYKYINPNLVVIVTQGISAAHKGTLNLYLIDVVSGNVIYSNVHKRTKGPVHIVHSENWLVYSYYNEKSRRTEIATLELYEGKAQSNTTVFSSLSNMKLPIVERQAFIFPAYIESLQETITEKGITSKHILVALANGGVLELPWILLDPRRPINPELREEGVIPYMPEIPIHMDSIINYNQSVYRVSGIHTSPSGLESTCLVFVYGLDLFYTRVAPSKTFDLLKEDFDYYLIVIVLSALVISSYVTKKLASQKVQKQAWK
ncbi:ER membrane protein complex subunit 1 isoform X2 [Copidosoma floridanum]|uniref:ER membrane protein complex subunit 1 isoform X2 n=1 Tax=Copidosoma floridanum TaxID=29053 RepID=UPI0006C9C7C9|nr:ER membrane protein complex subunit 1 isoform X2 [Copidosoma floridanum]